MIERRQLNYFSRPDFLRYDVRGGVLRSPGGTRMLAVSRSFLRGFVAACLHEAGPATGLILRRCGEFLGSRMARRMDAELGQAAGISLRDRTMAEFDALVRDLWFAYGLGEIDVDWSRGQHGFLAIQLIDSPTRDLGDNTLTGDPLLCGLLGGLFGGFGDVALRCVHTGELAQDTRAGSSFIVAPDAMVKQVEDLRSVDTPHAEIVASLSQPT